MGNMFSSCCGSSAGSTAANRSRQAVPSASSGKGKAARTRADMTDEELEKAHEYELALRAQATNPPGKYPEIIPEGVPRSAYYLRDAYQRAKSARAQEIGWEAVRKEIELDAAPRPLPNFAKLYPELDRFAVAALERRAWDAEATRQMRARGLFIDHEN